MKSKYALVKRRRWHRGPALSPSKRWLEEAKMRAEAGFLRDTTEWTNAKIAQERSLQVVKRARVLIDAIDESGSSPLVAMALEDLREAVTGFQVDAEAMRALTFDEDQSRSVKSELLGDPETP